MPRRTRSNEATQGADSGPTAKPVGATGQADEGRRTEDEGRPAADDRQPVTEAATTETATTEAGTEGGSSGGELERLRGELERLEGELAEAREQADRYHSNWQRSAADFQNWKRRADQEKEDARRLAEAGLTADLLRVLDDFERAFQALPPELRRLTWVEGVALIGQKLLTILHARGLEPIDALGQDFDPHLHEAVMREEDGDPSEQTSVVAELQRGYRFAGRVIRPTLVKVGKPSPTEAPVDASAGEPLGADASA